MPTKFQLLSDPQPVLVKDGLTIHNVRRKEQVPGILQLRGTELVVTATFLVAPANYKIKILALVRNDIAKTIDIGVVLTLRPATKLSASRQGVGLNG